MLVSILITSYNYARYLAAALDSALNQSHREVEVIVVDDGSTDESPEIIASYGDRVTAVLKPNGGPTSALNLAFEHSNGELICLLDADDVFEAGKVQAVVEAAGRTPDAQLIHHQLQMIDADGRPLSKPFPRYVADGDLRRDVVKRGGWFPHAVTSGLTFRRGFAERLFPLPQTFDIRIGGAPHRVTLGADSYLAGPAAMLAPIAGIDRPLARWRMHQSNRSRGFAGVPSKQIVRYQAEVEALAMVMRETFGQPVDLRVDQHLDYQLLRCAVGDASRARTAARVLAVSSLPWVVRWREVARVYTNRGYARRQRAHGPA